MKESLEGVIFQFYALFPKMSVEKNITYGLHLAGNRKARSGKSRKEIKVPSIFITHDQEEALE